jgi:hypothetical protein
MVFITRDGAYREYIKSRRENDGENKSSSSAGFQYKSNDYQDNAQDGRDYSGKLRTFAEKSSN